VEEYFSVIRDGRIPFPVDTIRAISGPKMRGDIIDSIAVVGAVRALVIKRITWKLGAKVI
jgi:hypothetical protein